MTRLVAAAGLFALLAAAQAAQQPAPRSPHESLQDILSPALGSAPGISAAYVDADGAVVAASIGVSDRETGRPLEPPDLLLAGSVGKTFVAARALQLIETGRLGLDEPIAKHLSREPWFARLPNGATARVRHLMTHSSGLVRYEFKEAFARDLRANPDKEWTPADRLAYVLGDTPPFAAGEGWEYSDTNFIVLGLILERIDGRPFYAQVRDDVLPLLGVRGADEIVPSVTRRINGLVQGYAAANDPIVAAEGPVIVDGKLVVNPQVEWTGGGFATSPRALARWGKALYEGRAFAKPETTALMIDSAIAARLGPQSKYGLGVIVRAQTPVGDVWGHSGYFPGYLTELIYLPAKRASIVVQVNTSNARALARSPLRIAYDIASLLK